MRESIWSQFWNGNMPENVEVLLSSLFWKAKPHFRPLQQDGEGAAAVFISVGAATQCGLLRPELSVFLRWQMGTCEENVVQLRPNFQVTIASALWPWGEADSRGGALWVMLFTHVWNGTCGNTHGQLTWEVLASHAAAGYSSIKSSVQVCVWWSDFTEATAVVGTSLHGSFSSFTGCTCMFDHFTCHVSRGALTHSVVPSVDCK